MNERIKSKFVKQHIKKLNQSIIVFKKRLHDSQKHQLKYKNIHIKIIKFQIKNYIHVYGKNIRIKRNKKLK